MNQALKGKKIVAVREMTDEEYEREGWSPSKFSSSIVIVLDDGFKLFASCDEEGNEAGALFGEQNGVGYQIVVEA